MPIYPSLHATDSWLRRLTRSTCAPCQVNCDNPQTCPVNLSTSGGALLRFAVRGRVNGMAVRGSVSAHNTAEALDLAMAAIGQHTTTEAPRMALSARPITG